MGERYFTWTAPAWRWRQGGGKEGGKEGDGKEGDGEEAAKRLGLRVMDSFPGVN